ncbi:MAG: hypothetical protein JST00_12565 [Deltaproteobacteria bacterium]|nr:hypothetical protein [Deltaproteobacteria bacterium]
MVELKSATEARVAHLQALLADAYLRARRAARSARALPLAIVAVPTVSERTARYLDDYARTFLDEGAAWGLLDGHGLLTLHGIGAEELSIEIAPRTPPPRVRPAKAFDAFSDLNQWMLKVLLAQRIPPALLSAPRARIRNARRLAIVANVSVPSATRFVAHMEREGWLVNDGRDLQLLRIEELLRRWQLATLRPARELRATWLLPSSDRKAQLHRALVGARGHADERGTRACLALFSAAEQLGYGHARGMSPCVYWQGSVDELLTSMNAFPAAEAGESDFVLRRPAFRESVFRGAVERRGALVTDVLQTWLDVASHPSRGQEHADHLWRRVIVPTLLERPLP